MRLKYLYKGTRTIAFRHLSLCLAIFLIPFACLFPLPPCSATRGGNALPVRNLIPALRFQRPATPLPTIYNDTEPARRGGGAAPRIRIVSFGIVADTACNITVKYRPIHGALYNITFHRNYDGILPNDRTRCSCSLFAPYRELRLD